MIKHRKKRGRPRTLRFLRCRRSAAKGDRDDDLGGYLPSPEEIRAACEKIRAGWPDSESNHRAQPPEPVRLRL